MLTNDEIVENTINEMKNYDFDKFKFLRENNVIKIYPDDDYINLVNKMNIYLNNKYILDDCYIFEFTGDTNIINKDINIHSFLRFNINILHKLIEIILKHEDYILFMCDVYPTHRMIYNGKYSNDINIYTNIMYHDSTRFDLFLRKNIDEEKLKDILNLLPSKNYKSLY